MTCKNGIKKKGSDQKLCPKQNILWKMWKKLPIFIWILVPHLKWVATGLGLGCLENSDFFFGDSVIWMQSWLNEGKVVPSFDFFQDPCTQEWFLSPRWTFFLEITIKRRELVPKVQGCDARNVFTLDSKYLLCYTLYSRHLAFPGQLLVRKYFSHHYLLFTTTTFYCIV